MGSFATLAGPFINSYAFCNLAKQRDAEVQSLNENVQKQRQYFDDPKNLQEFNKTRKENHVPEQYCWVN